MKPGVRAIDETGKRFGMLIAVRDVGADRNRRVWLYHCDCGKTVERVCVLVRAVAKRGGVPNCGCIISEVRSRNGSRNRTHGLSTHRLYDVWRQMHRRCYDPRCKDYRMYGKRGIDVCAAWHDLPSFIEWASGSGYRVGLTIERKDNDRGYSPSNCIWIPNERQALNTRRLVNITYKGKTAHASQWARETGIHVQTLLARKRRGWGDVATIETPAGVAS